MPLSEHTGSQKNSTANSPLKDNKHEFDYIDSLFQSKMSNATREALGDLPSNAH